MGIRDSERVLFVDDDPSSRRAFARAMRRSGFIIDMAESGEEALDLVSRYPYAVLAADWQMPGLDGLKLVERVRQSRPEPVCLLVTGAEEWQLRQLDFSALGISAVVRKPWDSGTMVSALRAALRCHRLRRAAGVSAEPPAARKRRVLLLEPEVERSAQLAQLLEQPSEGGFTSEQVATVEQAVERLESAPFDALIAAMEPLYCSTKPSQGHPDLSPLLAASPSLPLLVVGEEAGSELACRVIQAGAQDYLCFAQLQGSSLQRSVELAIERKRIEERLTHLAHHDPLTGLANRVWLEERLAQSLSRARRRQTLVAVFFLDLDRFKGINDEWGHEAGDELLQQVAGRLRGSIRQSDTVARLGGDEFVIVLEELERTEEATWLARRIINSFATPFQLKVGRVSSSTSVGIALYPHNGESVEALLKCADTAMYRAKACGRERYHFFSEELHARAVRQVQLERELRLAVMRDEFSVHYQPRVCTRTRAVVGFEALLRWRRDGSLIPAKRFLALLESTGMLISVGEWVLRQACAQLQRWNSTLPWRLHAAVNISARQLGEAGFVDMVRQVLLDHSLAGTDLQLEVAEGVLTNSGELESVCTELRELGVQLVIDDFGTGRLALSDLQRLPIRGMKVDGRLLDQAAGHRDGAKWLEAVIALGGSLQLEVTAEGIETPAQLSVARRYRCPFIQGHLVGPPRDAAGASAWLEQVIASGGIWLPARRERSSTGPVMLAGAAPGKRTA